jgi:hypothetical protein
MEDMIAIMSIFSCCGDVLVKDEKIRAFQHSGEGMND